MGKVMAHMAVVFAKLERDFIRARVQWQGRATLEPRWTEQNGSGSRTSGPSGPVVPLRVVCCLTRVGAFTRSVSFGPTDASLMLR
jgi:hypothetical protein